MTEARIRFPIRMFRYTQINQASGFDSYLASDQGN